MNCPNPANSSSRDSGGGGGDIDAAAQRSSDFVALRAALLIERNIHLVHGSIVDRKLVVDLMVQ